MTDSGVPGLRHAFLILTHTGQETLHRLLDLLDDPLNDIFLHVDRKFVTFDEASARARLQHSRLSVQSQFSVSWGGFTLVAAQLALIKTALPGGYDYYHLLSGMDLPIKPMAQIHRFFAEHNGKEFIRFTSRWDRNRVIRYHAFNEVLHSRKLVHLPLRALSFALTTAQKLLGISRRCRVWPEFQKGSNWASFTRELAQYLIDHQRDLEFFRHARCSDEHYLQTVAWNSPFRNALFHPGTDDDRSSQRLVVWSRTNGNSPRTLVMEDAESIRTSDLLFARKFDLRTDSKIFDYVASLVRPQTGRDS